MAQRRAAPIPLYGVPRVALFCPVKRRRAGPGAKIFCALVSFLSLDHPDYEIFFPMASADDPARKIIERVTAAASKHKIQHWDRWQANRDYG